MQQLEHQRWNGPNYLETKTNMAEASTNKTLLLGAYCSKTAINTEFLSLYVINSSSNLHLPYWKYDLFSLEGFNDGECKSEFRFFRENIYILHYTMNVLEMFTCFNGVKVTGIEGLCILLKRYSYPNRSLDLIPMFGRPVPQLFMITNHVMNFIYERWHHLLTSFNQPWLSPANLKRHANCITKLELH